MRLIARALRRWFVPRTEVGIDYIPRTDVCSYLDEAITFWRARRKDEGATAAAALAQGYVDAFQSARVSLLGEPLPEVKP